MTTTLIGQHAVGLHLRFEVKHVPFFIRKFQFWKKYCLWSRF